MGAQVPRRLDHAAIYCSDLERSIEWYGRVLGLELAYVGPIGAFFDVGDTILGLRQARIRLEGLSEQHLAFAVDDLEAAFEKVSVHDVRVLERGVITEGYIKGQTFFDIAGPDGEDIEFVQRANITINDSTLHPEATYSH
ncbi:MAG TPA: VOC family protein [Acidimicrobiales bacterium]|nr:VOC family protein [Acidimicrobiales bacterium]